MKKTLVIMAAGMGSRYGGLKQIDKVGPSGELIIDYAIYDAHRAGFTKVVFVIKEENEALFREVIGDRISRFMDVCYVYQRIDNLPKGYNVPEGRVKPWGTAHAVMSCIGSVDSPFVVINADDFYGRQAFQKISDWIDNTDFDKKPAEYCMAGYILKNTLTDNGHVARGVCRVDDCGNLVDVTERTKIMRRAGKVQYTEDDVNWVDIDENSIVSMNCWCFAPSFLNEVKARFKDFLEANKDNILKAEFFLPFVVQDMIDQGQCTVRVLKTGDQWFGVTYKEDKEKVVNAIVEKVERGEYPKTLWE
jgi:dTDP-glucose pyrophosphorylase